MTSRQLRALRGGAAAFAATLVAACAHTLAGGGPPPMLLVVAIAVLATPAGVALIGRTRSLPRLAAVILLAQTMFHGFFALTAGAGAPADAVVDHGAHGAFHLGLTGADLVAPEPGMIVAHVGAAVLTIALVRRGERIVAVVARGLAHAVRLRIPALPAPLAAPAVLVGDGAARRVVARVFTSVVSRRGPPAF